MPSNTAWCKEARKCDNTKSKAHANARDSASVLDDVAMDSPYTTSGASSGSDTSEEPPFVAAAPPIVAPTGPRKTLVQAGWDTVNFYRSLLFYFCGGEPKNCPYFADSPQARAQLYSLFLVLWMWNRPHYRAGSFQTDMLTNLRNVAIPGTGIALSWLVQFRIVAFVFLIIGYPLVCLIAGLRKGGFRGAATAYSEQLLTPQDWFSFWRLNCVLASYHSQVTHAKGFHQEDKWTFLKSAEKAGIAVSPWLQPKTLVIKDKNEEGGMGIHFFSNAVHGGQWIIQEKLSNDAFISSLLPQSAPLSTLRVITSSKGGLRASSLPASCASRAPLPGSPVPEDVSTLSCVFRAGRAHADTDHNCILFDVDCASGEIRKGTTNMHWYQLGPDKVFTTPWLNLEHTITTHPDCDGEAAVTGHTIPNMSGIKHLCESAHLALLPDVPLAGWDVALTEEAGMCLLEVNLSCNFFRGSFDQKAYFDFVNDYFEFLGNCPCQTNQQKNVKSL